ncbi:hypothetical protein OQJ18_08395 [Fluoribacter dumoffii]|uniref:Uncharacterized protein n=1 Tax=Fluoribacter dumoffii TaxID=463 RepID=A0A377G8D9_9GAMM|nr:hypothetical protein [Fluoribacter dumoffii]KTC89629.1 hypothetical protein Ldum_0697 [Fluoribacter dumoffii NY 23]MCW8384822.1 hypothetical protein [Fluoribacter dumoffii]MCW8417885.1 hypothetical protein [Fluoribacter dumoffii]MCW8454273.1 hypothetical protein [Fluoribacter dumoffii]MCW8461653.1 hypothetical protein [Fluoribacter dumoffii]
MKTAIKNVYLVTALSLSTLSAYADNPSSSTTNTSTTSTETSSTTSGTSSVLGNYQCQRADASNNTASYPMSITKTGDTYTLEWDSSAGDPVLYGTGVMHPNATNVIAASFWDPRKPDTIGIQMIEVKSDGSLQSNWVLQSDNQIGTETCTKSK